MKRTVFITGAASGLGAVKAEEFADHGWEVFAAGHVTPGAAPHGIPITLDVTDCDSCAAAAREVAAHTDGLGAVINFAGLRDLGPLMEVSEERLRRIFDVNVIGTHRVNRAMFDLVRAGGGRIVNISSESGRFRAGITTRPYAMTKHALEAYSDALRQELLFVGIPVIVIEPGVFRTAMSQHIPERLSASVPPDHHSSRSSRSPDARVQGKRNIRGTRRSWCAPYIARSPGGGPSRGTWSMEECRAELWTFCPGRWLTGSSGWWWTCGRMSPAVLKGHQT